MGSTGPSVVPSPPFSLENGDEMEISQHIKCGETKIKRWAVSIEHCGSCMKRVLAGPGSTTLFLPSEPSPPKD